jgi:hypothetical protein
MPSPQLKIVVDMLRAAPAVAGADEPWRSWRPYSRNASHEAARSMT